MTKIPKVRRLRRHEASRYLNDAWGIRRTPKTLAKLAVVGGGPAFRKDGRFPLYEPDSLDEWACEQLSESVRSTAELRVNAQALRRRWPKCGVVAPDQNIAGCLQPP